MRQNSGVRASNGASGGLRFVHAYLHRRYKILFYTLLFTLMSAPILSALKFSGTLLESFPSRKPACRDIAG